MKRLLAIVITFAILSTACLSTAIITNADNEKTYTKIVTPVYIDENEDEIKIADDSTAFPESVLLEGTATPVKSPSYLPLDTIASVKSYAKMRIKGTKAGKGAIFYIKAPDSTSSLRPQIYLMLDNTSMQFQYTGATWYTLDKNSIKWNPVDIDNYGPLLYAGFDGYLYIPYDQITLTGSAVARPITDDNNIDGMQVWSSGLKTDETFMISAPIIVTKDGLDQSGLPTCDKVLIGETEAKYFDKEEVDPGDGSQGDNSDDNIPAYDGEEIKYDSADIMKIKTAPLADKVKIGSPIPKNAYDDWSDTTLNKGTTLVESLTGLTKAPSYKIERKTEDTSANKDILCSFYSDLSKSDGAESLMFYLKMPENSGETLLKTLHNFYDPDGVYFPAYIVSGYYSILPKGSDKWIDISATSYYCKIPAGFEGYVRIDYRSLYNTGELKIDSRFKIFGTHIYIPNLNGEPVYVSAPVLITHIGNTAIAAAYLNDETKAARDLFTGNIVKKEDIVKPLVKGEIVKSLPDYTTDLVILPPDDKNIKSSSFSVSWEATPGAKYYKVELYKKMFSVEELTFQVIDFKDVDGTSTSFENLEETTDYVVLVRAMDANNSELAVYDYLSVSTISSDEENDYGSDTDNPNFGSDYDSDYPTTSDVTRTNVGIIITICVISLAVLVYSKLRIKAK